MNVNELIAEAQARVPLGSAFGTRHQAQGCVGSGAVRLTVVVAMRIDGRGRRQEQYFCDGTRVPRHVLLRLTCAEAECPQARAVRLQWNDFHRRDSRTEELAAPDAARGRPLLEEIPIAMAGHRCMARAARFNCFTPCPNDAHPPMWIDKSGFDLFEDGVCIGGGVAEAQGTRRPRLPTLQAAEAYLLARHFEALAMLDGVASSGRGGRS